MNAAGRSTVPRIGLVSLGCAKAVVDAERVVTELRARGYRVSEDCEGADLVIVNTCGFIDAAVRESLDAIGEALADNGRVIVTGCLGSREEVVRENHPDVLAVTGPDATEQVLAAVSEHLPPVHDPRTSLIPPGGHRLTPRHYAWLKISEGCNHRCSFCIIPRLRGDLQSRPAGEVLAEAEALVDAGVRELLVVSQDTGAYGADLRYRTDFHGPRPVRSHITDLARALGELGVWVRLHYVYPYPHVDEIVALMAEGLILPYLDVPLQHASPRILRAMKRPAATGATLERIRRWRELCPDLTLRSTFITGFPGETEADFQELLEFLDAARLDHVGCFTYSPVEGAAANGLPDPVPEEVKADRQARLLDFQAPISAERRRRWQGREIVCLVDRSDDTGVQARGPADAPEVDGILHLPPSDLEAGDFVRARVVRTDDHDAWGVYTEFED